jgi:predicted MFS family arabinose efflux permease
LWNFFEIIQLQNNYFWMPNLKYQKVDQNSGEENRNSVETMDNPAISRISTSEDLGGIIGPTNFPSTHSSQQLMSTDNDSICEEQKVSDSDRQEEVGFSSIKYKEWLCVSVLCFINLINYMDRFTIAGVLPDIQAHFKIGDDEGGLLQTAFILSYMIFAPIFGYLGDRYSRKHIMAFGIALWGCTTLLGSYMDDFKWFIVFRAMVGIGEASYSTIAPTLISDMFVHNMRSKMLAFFYFAIPVGSGLGYIVGSETARAMGAWQWSLRVTPILGLIAVILILFIEEPARGQSEGTIHMESTSYVEDVKDIVKNKSFMLSTAGFTCVAFVAGALSWWGPKFMHLGLQLQPGNENIKLSEVSFIFGAMAMCAGLLGVPLGSYLSQRLIKKYKRIDPIICACGLIISAPLIAGAMLAITANSTIAYILVFFGQLTLNLNWAIVADILLYVVVPTRRSTAEAFQILISHALGDAGSPYLVGVISEALKPLLRSSETPKAGFGGDMVILSQLAENATTTLSPVSISPFYNEDDSVRTQFYALQYSMFQTSFVEVLGGVFFLLTAAYVLKDRTNVERAVHESATTAEPNQYNSNQTVAVEID